MRGGSLGNCIRTTTRGHLVLNSVSSGTLGGEYGLSLMMPLRKGHVAAEMRCDKCCGCSVCGTHFSCDSILTRGRSITRTYSLNLWQKIRSRAISESNA